MMNRSYRPLANIHLARAAVALALLLCTGTIGYHLLEGFDFIDSLYMTVITMSTVGYGEVHPLSASGRLFTIGLIFAGAAIVAYAVSVGIEILLSGEWSAQWVERRKKRMLAEFNHHVIVCGFGRVGRFVTQELRAEGVPYLVIEKDPERAAHAEHLGNLVLQGNAANEGLLQQAGIDRARGLVAAVDSDAENVYITLTARGMQPDLEIISRANFEESESKLMRAGATRVLLPYRISGRRMVTMLVRPDVADFLDEVTHAEGMELLLEQVCVSEGSALAGLPLAEARAKTGLDVSVLAYKKPGSSANLRPGPESVLQPGVQILVLGTRDQLKELIHLATGK
jgi:voltage-gated potassium channel